jgi:class 3 adenylate cyclase
MNPEAVAEAAHAAMRSGDLLSAHDLAERGLRDAPDDAVLKYLTVLTLARSGATELAAQRYKRLDLEGAARAGSRLGMDIHALAARLAKDRALAAPPAERTALLLLAASAYQQLFEASDDPYPGTNAAALALWAGDRPRAAAIASRALAALDRNAKDPQDYWSMATEAELHLLEGNADAAAKTIDSIARNLRQGASVDWQAVASTRRQIRRSCRHLAMAPTLLDPLRPPMVIAYSGHMIGARFVSEAEHKVANAIHAQLAEEGVGCAFGSLAGGADILFAEALLDRGSELNVVLPFAREDFIAQSVRPSGPSWPERFERCLLKATSVRYATKNSIVGDDADFRYAIHMAMGHALLRARMMDAPHALFAAWDGKWPDNGRSAGTGADILFWRSLGHEAWIISPEGQPVELSPASSDPPVRVPSGDRVNAAILFADIQGYGRLREADLPLYMNAIVTPLSCQLDKHGVHVLARNSWGDAIFAVLDDVLAAAECAFAMQMTMAAVDRDGLGFPIDLNLRIALHFGPIRAVFDPIQGRDTYMGVQIVQAARIEPVTEPGMTYVTEAFAAALALLPGTPFACDYLGEVDTAKGFGRLSLYALRAGPFGD